MVEIASIFGILGAITAASLFYPQVWASYKTKKTQGLSLYGIIIGMLNGVFWTTYGVLKTDPFIYITNIILFIGASLLIVLKKKYG